MALVAILMISTVRYPSGKQVDLQTKTRLTTFVPVFICVAGIVLFKEVGLLTIALAYIGYGLVRHVRRMTGARLAPPDHETP
jgi:CDP-diacylglycerol--serine O-phosphatidyltransferase